MMQQRKNEINYVQVGIIFGLLSGTTVFITKYPIELGILSITFFSTSLFFLGKVLSKKYTKKWNESLNIVRIEHCVLILICIVGTFIALWNINFIEIFNSFFCAEIKEINPKIIFYSSFIVIAVIIPFTAGFRSLSRKIFLIPALLLLMYITAYMFIVKLLICG